LRGTDHADLSLRYHVQQDRRTGEVPDWRHTRSEATLSRYAGSHRIAGWFRVVRHISHGRLGGGSHLGYGAYTRGVAGKRIKKPGEMISPGFLLSCLVKIGADTDSRSV